MPLRSRSRVDAPAEHFNSNLSNLPTAQQHSSPAEGPVTGEAKIHILADGRIVVDLTVGDPRPTTDIACPNCSGSIRVEHVDADLRRAELQCLDCHFHFAQRLQPRADDEVAQVAVPARRGLFSRRR